MNATCLGIGPKLKILLASLLAERDTSMTRQPESSRSRFKESETADFEVKEGRLELSCCC
jgi:hypothetical protein